MSEESATDEALSPIDVDEQQFSFEEPMEIDEQEESSDDSMESDDPLWLELTDLPKQGSTKLTFRKNKVITKRLQEVRDLKLNLKKLTKILEEQNGK